jgi:hypothetical protein
MNLLRPAATLRTNQVSALDYPTLPLLVNHVGGG